MMSREPSIPARLRDVHRIVVVGDSITELGADPGGYVSLLEHALAVLDAQHPIEIVNAGVSGDRSPDMLARFERDVLAHRPDLVAISVGTNDVWHAFHDWDTGLDHAGGDLPSGVPLNSFTSNLDAMMRMAEAAGIRVVLLSPAIIGEDLDGPGNLRLADYVRADRDLAAAHGCLFIDLNAPFRQVIALWRQHAGPTMNLLTTDGVHLNAAGNHLMAATILRELGAGSDTGNHPGLPDGV
jgi:acyl-CoA thioesterase-1